MRRSTHPVVGLQFVDLLFVHLHPKVLADELDDLERVREAWPLLGVPLDQALADLEADRLELPPRVLQLRRRRVGLAAEQHLHQLHVQVQPARLLAGAGLRVLQRVALANGRKERGRTATSLGFPGDVMCGGGAVAAPGRLPAAAARLHPRGRPADVSPFAPFPSRCAWRSSSQRVVRPFRFVRLTVSRFVSTRAWSRRAFVRSPHSRVVAAILRCKYFCRSSKMRGASFLPPLHTDRALNAATKLLQGLKHMKRRCPRKGQDVTKAPSTAW